MATTRIFEQSEQVNPSLTKKLAFGASGVITENIKLSDFIVWLFGKLAFLKTANNLSDLANAETARTNLGVYSAGETDDLLDEKAGLYPEVGGALGTANAVEFIPTTVWHPATKNYVDIGGISSGWLDGVRNSIFVEPTDFSCKIARVGGFNTITGRLGIKAGEGATEGSLLVTLPISTELCTVDIYFVACDQNNDENLELMIPANTRTIVISASNPSTGTTMNFHVTYPHI
jgi:hypothetical protein